MGVRRTQIDTSRGSRSFEQLVAVEMPGHKRHPVGAVAAATDVRSEVICTIAPGTHLTSRCVQRMDRLSSRIGHPGSEPAAGLDDSLNTFSETSRGIGRSSSRRGNKCREAIGSVRDKVPGRLPI